MNWLRAVAALAYVMWRKAGAGATVTVLMRLWLVAKALPRVRMPATPPSVASCCIAAA